MVNRPRFDFISTTFLIGFGIGSFVGVALALVALAVARGPDSSSSKLTVAATSTPIDSAVAALPTVDSRPRTKSQLDVHLGPGSAYAVVGSIQRDEAVDVVGRDNDSNWVAIRFPPGSAARGWLQVGDLDNLTGLEKLAVSAPTPLPRSVSIPAPAPSSSDLAVISGATPAVRVTVPATPATPAIDNTLLTPRPGVGPVDLVVIRLALLNDGHVGVVIGNRGPGDVSNGSVFVIVRDAALHTEQLVTNTRIPAGSSVSLETSSFLVTRETDVTAVVDPFGSMNDRDRSNNTLTATLTPPFSPTPIPGLQ